MNSMPTGSSATSADDRTFVDTNVLVYAHDSSEQARIVLLEPVLILAASRLHETASILFWDALIVEAARVAGAGRILSEDLADGQLFEGIRVENPFQGLAAGARRNASSHSGTFGRSRHNLHYRKCHRARSRGR